MTKKLVFISHIHEEKEIANAFKELIEKSFLGMIEVFISSNDSNIGMGQRWLDNITGALKNASVEILLCSPKSVERPWINFEAGAGWIKDIPVIPLCHSGMTPSKLPIPLNMLQAATASELPGLKLIFPVLANAIGSAVPNVDFSDFIEKVKDFEERYTFWEECNLNFSELNTFNSQIIPALKMGKIIHIDLLESDLKFLEPLMSFFIKKDLLTLERQGNVKMTTSGTYYDCLISPLRGLPDVLNDKHFKF